MEDIEKNTSVFVLLGYEKGVFDKDYVEIEATVPMTRDPELIDRDSNSYR